MSNHQKLRIAVEQLSKSTKGFLECIKEWHIVSYEFDAVYLGKCECGRRGIKHIFIIENMYNGNRLSVGESCVNYLFNREYFSMMTYLKRAVRTKNWLPTEGMVNFSIEKKYINERDGAIIKRYISQRLRITGLSIHQEVCRCCRKLLVNLMNNGNMSEKVIFKILNDIPPPSVHIRK